MAKMRFPESDLCKMLFRWFTLQYSHTYGHLLMRIEVGGRKNKTTSAILKGEGSRAGMTDYFLAQERTIGGIRYSGLWLEVKIDTGTVSPNQIEFMDCMRVQGYAAFCGYGFEECKNIIKAYLNYNADYLSSVTAYKKGGRKRA